MRVASLQMIHLFALLCYIENSCWNSLNASKLASSFQKERKLLWIQEFIKFIASVAEIFITEIRSLHEYDIFSVECKIWYADIVAILLFFVIITTPLSEDVYSFSWISKNMTKARNRLPIMDLCVNEMVKGFCIKELLVFVRIFRCITGESLSALMLFRRENE